ncbi:hypothetical protein HY488_02390 [Candidatus Woesearchaeota archaeon]|nr:hypothetical protein [Candidatus Woesearchaeota archaeon]
MSFFLSLQATRKLLWREKKHLLPLTLLDLTFFVLFALLHTFIVLQALPDLSAMNQLIAKESLNVPQVPLDAENVDPSQLQFSFPIEEFQTRFAVVIKFAALYLLVMFILYNLFFAYTWLKTSILLKKKQMPYLQYLKRFAGINALWILLFIVGSYLLVIAATATMFGQIAIISSGVVDAVGIALGVLLLYFAMISHALLIDYPTLSLLKKTFALGIQRIATLGPAFLLIGALYYLVVELLSRLSAISVVLSFVLFILLFVPLVTGSRMFFMAAAEEASRRMKKET